MPTARSPHRLRTLAVSSALAWLAVAAPQAALAADGARHDAFFWLGEINKASTVINTDEGLLERTLAPRVAGGIAKVLADGDKPGGKRPSLVITFEPLMIQAAGQEVTLIHAGRSSQDMLATVRAAMLREEVLGLADQLDKTSVTIVKLARQHAGTIVPNYTNGVAAQPNSYGHYLLGIQAGLERDAQRLREAYQRIDRSPMGTTVLNGTGWPLDRQRMAGYLGFSALVDNAYDASQISAVDLPVEVGAIVTSIALHVGGFIEDVMTQYAQPRPWILLQEGGGNTYVSSAMPQKRNPGLLNSTREKASTAITLAMGPVIRAHNLPPGMSDAKDAVTNGQMVQSAVTALQGLDRIMTALVIDRQRALEELDSDWTASQELADELMRKYKLPFRVGHHFASNLVDYAKAHDIRPSAFPYAEARRIYAESVHDYGSTEFPMSEAEFRAALDPVAIVNHRVTSGGPQPAEMERMLKAAEQDLARQQAWIQARRGAIDASLARLDRDFDKLLK